LLFSRFIVLSRFVRANYRAGLRWPLWDQQGYSESTSHQACNFISVLCDAFVAPSHGDHTAMLCAESMLLLAHQTGDKVLSVGHVQATVVAR
jgi:hypothetical protein